MDAMAHEFSWQDIPGLAGFVLYALAYLLVSLKRLRAEDMAFFVLNGAAAGLILTGLYLDFNLGSVLTQIFYLTVSLVAILARLRPAPVRAEAPAG